MSKKATEFQKKEMSRMYRGKEIFKPLNVKHCHPASVLLGDKSAGNAGNRRFNRNTGIHESKC